MYVPLYEYSKAVAIVLMSPSILRAQFSASPISFRELENDSTRFSHNWVCLAKFVALCCSCFASASSFFWFKYAWATLLEASRSHIVASIKIICIIKSWHLPNIQVINKSLCQVTRGLNSFFSFLFCQFILIIFSNWINNYSLTRAISVACLTLPFFPHCLLRLMFLYNCRQHFWSMLLKVLY